MIKVASGTLACSKIFLLYNHKAVSTMLRLPRKHNIAHEVVFWHEFL